MARDYFKVRQGVYIFKDDEVLLLKNQKGTWGVVGGHLELGEQPLEGLKREVKEEASVEITHPIELTKFTRNDDLIILYVAHYKSGNVMISDEHQEYMWIHYEKANELELTHRSIVDDLKHAYLLLQEKK